MYREPGREGKSDGALIGRRTTGISFRRIDIDEKRAKAVWLPGASGRFRIFEKLAVEMRLAVSLAAE